jgi:NitT/TauT family transport system substrate-binding protein
MLASDQVAATINWLTVAPAFEGPLREVNKTFKAIPWSENGFDGYGLSLLASEKILTQRPEAVKKFVAVYGKAIQAAVADPHGTAEALKAMVPEIDVATAEAQWKASIPLMVNDISRKDGMGTFEPKLLKTTWEWVAKSQNMAADKIDPDSAIAHGYLK